MEVPSESGLSFTALSVGLERIMVFTEKNLTAYKVDLIPPSSSSFFGIQSDLWFPDGSVGGQF